MGDIIWEVFILQIIMIIVLSAIVIYLLKTSKSIKYEKRINNSKKSKITNSGNF